MFSRCAHTEPKAVKNGKPVKLEIIEPANQGCQLSFF